MPGINYRYLLSKVKKSAFSKIILFLMVPIVFFLFSTVLTYRYYVKYFEEETKKAYVNALSSISETVDNIFYEIYRTNMLLSTFKPLENILTSDVPVSPSDIASVMYCRNSLASFRATKSLIDNAYVVLKSSNMVISCDGSVSMNIFFDKTCRYQGYPEDFWRSLSPKSQELFILKPSIVESTSAPQKEKNIIPVVQAGIGQQYSKNLFVVNVDEAGLCNILDSYRFTPGSLLFITDTRGNILSQARGKDLRELPDYSILIGNALKQKEGFFYSGSRSNRMLNIIHSSSIMSNRFVYVACVPLSDIEAKSSRLKKLAYAVSLITLLIVVILSVFMARSLYSPIRRLVSTMQSSGMPPDSGTLNNEFEYIHTGIQSMLGKTETLARDLSQVLPLAGEQYLLKLINQFEFADEQQATDYLAKGRIIFNHGYFAVIVVHFGLSESFYTNFSKNEQVLVLNGTIKLLSGIFPEAYTAYPVFAEKDRIFVVVNLDSMELEQQIADIIHEFLAVFENDSSFIRMYAGIGLIHERLSGISQSFQEAVEAVSTLSRFSSEKIKIYNDEKRHSEHVIMPEDRHKLANFLAGGMKTELYALLDIIVDRNIKNNVNESGMKELYLHLYDIGRRILTDRGLSPEAVMGEHPIDLINAHPAMTSIKMGDDISLFFEKIMECIGMKHRKLDITEIRDFVHAHYTEEIYLEQIAARYQTSAAYLSRILKDSFGMPFQQYLACLRIEKAKELLLNSRIAVNKIGAMAGFNSRNTFIRMFKKLEGLTPSEFRHISKK